MRIGFSSTLVAAALLALPTLRADLPDGYGTIYLNAHGSTELRDSAEDLADLLRRTFGERPVICRAPLMGKARGIHIGPAADHDAFDTDPLTDEILIERRKNRLYIHGSDNSTTRLAIYRFAEEVLGWRYYQPDELGLERIDDPPEPPPVRGDDAVILHSTAAYISRNPKFGPTGGPYSWETWHGLRERFRYNHMVHRVVAPTLFDTHPDWFAKDGDGQPMRPPYYPRVHGYNDHPDLTNEVLRDFITTQVLDALDGAPPPPRILETPGSLSVSLSLGDSFVFGSFPDSYPWKPDGYFRRWPDWSNHVFAFTNAVAAAVEKRWQAGQPDNEETTRLYFGTLAYLNWENVPDFPLHPSIVPYMTFDRSQWYDEAARDDDLANVSAWNETAAPFTATWDYLFGYGFLIPRSMTAIVSESIPALHERGVRAYFSQVAPLWPFDGHTNWLTTRLLWDPEMDAAAALDEYFREYFGPAETPMRAFFALSESIWMRQEAEGWWLRFWKDPWQVGLWTQAELREARNLLTEALQNGSPGTANNPRFSKRVRQVAKLFDLTEALYRYQSLTWQLQAAGERDIKTRLALAAKAIEARKALVAARDRALSMTPLVSFARDLSWIFRYDSLGANVAAIARETTDPAILEETEALLGKWTELENPGTVELLNPLPVLYDTDLSETENPRIWSEQFMDSEGMEHGTVETSGYRVADVRRGHLYQLFAAEPGRYYLGEADVETLQSLSGEVYIRIDFFNTNHELLTESRRSRIAPVALAGSRQTLRALHKAPPETAYGRLFIRFYEMDAGSEAVVKAVRVNRVGRHQDP